jgi:hypothetical protein
LNTFFWILLAVLCLPYLAVPLLLWRSQRFFPNPALTRHLPDFLPPPVQAYLDQVENDLAARGYESRADGLSRDHYPETDLFVRILINPESRTLATVTALLVHGENARVIQRFVEFFTRVEGGLELTTHNCDVLGAPIEWPHRKTLALEPKTETGQMVALHERAVMDQFGSTKRLLPPLGRELETVQETMHEELRQQVELGGLRLDEGDGLFRPTLAGAILMAWSSLWPVTAIRRALRRRRTRSWRRAMEN